MSVKDQVRIANKLKGESISVVLNAITVSNHEIKAYHPKVFALGGSVDIKG